MGQAWLELFSLIFLFFSLVYRLYRCRAWACGRTLKAIERSSWCARLCCSAQAWVNRRHRIDDGSNFSLFSYIAQTQSCYGLCATAAHFSALFFALCGCARVARSSSFIRFALDEEKKLYEEIWKNIKLVFRRGFSRWSEISVLYVSPLLCIYYTQRIAISSLLFSCSCCVYNFQDLKMKNLFLGTIKLY